MEWLAWNAEQNEWPLELPGMQMDSICQVHVRQWRHASGATWELWRAKGPMRDWSVWNTWGGDSHCLWYRVYPSDAWGMLPWMLQHKVPEERRWDFHAAGMEIDTTEARRATAVA